MRALRVHDYGEPSEALVLDLDVPLPEPEPGHLQVEVGAAALGLPDVLLCRGKYQLHPDLPFSPGMEAAGIVSAVGEGVSTDLIGRRVVGVPALPSGALAESCIFAAHNAYPIPDDVDNITAVSSHISGTTAHLGLHQRAQLQPGETLLVHAGAGGTGSAAIQVGCIAGARVIATAGSAERAKLCEDLGADIGINSSSNDISQAVLTATDGRGADVIFDPVGGTIFDASRKCIASEGRLIVIGFAGGEIQQIPANHVLLRNYSVLGLYVGAYAHDQAGQALMQGVHGELMAMIAKGSFRPLVSGVISLDEVPGALEALRDRSVTGRVVVDLHQP